MAISRSIVLWLVTYQIANLIDSVTKLSMLNIKIKQLTIVTMWETIVIEKYNNETIYSTEYCQSLVTVKGLATVNEILNFLCS